MVLRGNSKSSEKAVCTTENLSRVEPRSSTSEEPPRVMSSRVSSPGHSELGDIDGSTLSMWSCCSRMEFLIASEKIRWISAGHFKRNNFWKREGFVSNNGRLRQVNVVHINEL